MNSHRGAHSPTDLPGRSWKDALKRTVKAYSAQNTGDLAAALTYYAVLALFPALIALLALVGLFGQGASTVKAINDILSDLGASSAADTLEPTLNQLASASGAAGFAFVLGIATALWSASGYVGSFSRAMNRIYGVEEGRPFWKLRPQLLVVTIIAILMAAFVALALVLTGSAARAVGNQIGLGDQAVDVWEIAKWPVVLAAVILVVALLYYATPNVKQPKFRWVSVGAAAAILIWIVASAAFGFYVANFSSYNKTYGTLAGAVVFLLWLWLTNVALLVGAILDSEIERSRELEAGIPAEEELHLPLRDTTKLKDDPKESVHA